MERFGKQQIAGVTALTTRLGKPIERAAVEPDECPCSSHSLVVHESISRPCRYQTLDALRGLACLMVIGFHANFRTERIGVPAGIVDRIGSVLEGVWQRGWLAVPAFFLVSGYGISHAMDLLRPKPNAARWFAVSRLRRLFPPYLLAMLLFVLAVEVWDFAMPFTFADYAIRDPSRLSVEQWIGNYSLTELYREHFFGPPDMLVAGHFWTLHHELQFYLIVALVLLFLPRRYFAVMTAISVSAILVQFSPGWFRKSLDGFIVHQYWLAFAAGILVYWHLNYATARQKWLANVVLLMTMLAAVIDWETVSAPNWSARAGLAFTAGLAIALANGHHWDRHISDSPLVKSLAACGAISYSVYLTHPLVVRCSDIVSEDWLDLSANVKTLVVVPIVLVVSLGAGGVFYWTVERHFTGSVSGRLQRNGSRATLAPLPAVND